MRNLGLSLVAVVLLVMAAGCGGEKSSNNEPESTRGSGGSTPAAGATKAPDTAPTTSGDTGSASGDDTGQFKSMIEKFIDSKFRATYTMTGGAEDDITDGKLVMIKDGSKRLRFDISGTQAGEKVSLIFIDNDGKTVFCLENAGELGQLFGIADGEGVCLNSPPDDQSMNPTASLTEALTDLESGKMTLVSKSSKKVSGRDATCFVSKTEGEEGTDEECFSKDGVLLSSRTGSSGSTIEATEIGGSIGDSDFEPPFEVRDMPGTSGSLDGGQ